MRRTTSLSVLLLIFVPCIAFAAHIQPTKVRIYVEPQGTGFESYIAAAIVKKNTPAVVTTDRDAAEYVLTSKVLSKEESTGSKVARCLFMYCAGIDGQQTVTVELVGKNKEIVWAYNVRKLGAHNYQSSAEAVAKHLKKYLEDKGK